MIKEIEELDLSLLNDKIVLGVVISRKDPPEPVFFIFKFISKDESVPIYIKYDYEECSIIRKTITLNDFKNMLKTEGEILKILIENQYVTNITDFRKNYTYSNKSYGLFQAEFPTLYYYGNITGTKNYITTGEVTSKDSPPFPCLADALNHIFEVKIDRNFEQRQLAIIVPDLRARIKKVIIDQEKINAQIENNGYDKNGIILQIYISGNGIIESKSDVKIQEGIGTITFKHGYEHIMIVLFTKSGKKIDQKDITMYGQLDSSVSIKISTDSLRDMIKRGESEKVEFKVKLNNPEPFVTSVSSFANGTGGKILIGVDDGKIIGVSNPKELEMTVTNWIAQYCDPRITCNIYFSFEEKILIVDIPQGNKKPYFVKGRGCYIRHGGVDVQATRVETEHLMKEL